MKKRVLRILAVVATIGLIFIANRGWDKVFSDNTVQAFGDLLVNFHVPVGSPIFNLINMKPGDSQTKQVDVTNNGSSQKFISVRGQRSGGAGDNPKIETILSVSIKEGASILYGPKTMSNFLADSLDTNGIPLNTVNSGNNRTYSFQVNLPTTAGNEFQGKSVTANLTFDTISANDLVINEVFYNVDNNHGLKEPKDKDERDEDDYERRHGIKNKRFHDKRLKTRLKFQWIELYNPTNQDILLKDWKLYNDDGLFAVIHANKKIKASSFALLSKDDDLWKFWSGSKSALKIEIGSYFGSGLSVDGNRIILKNPNNIEVDRMSWGDDISGFNTSAVNPKVAKGHSTERQSPGFDTNAAADWLDRNPPTPGN